MFGSIGIPEIIVIFIVALLLFGPNKLPEFAKTFGKAAREFRKTINEAKSTIEQEIEKAGISEDIKDIDISEDLKEIDHDIQKISRMDINDDNEPKQ